MDESTVRLLAALREDLGETIAKYLGDEACEDIVLNEDGKLRAKRLGEGWTVIGNLSRNEALGAISAVARLQNRIVDHDHPVLETILPTDGSRFEAVLPPIVRSPIFSIRSRAKTIFTLDDYVRQGIMTSEQKDRLREAVLRKRTILLSGSTGSGKTTLVNAFLHEIAQEQPAPRLGIVEDTPELQYAGDHSVSLLAQRGEDSMLECLRIVLRLRVDRIVVGEVRDKSALVMLKAYNTGHPGGLSTIHANDAQAALLRLESLVQEAVPHYNARPLVEEAIQVIAHMDGPTPTSGRKLREIVEV